MKSPAIGKRDIPVIASPAIVLCIFAVVFGSAASLAQTKNADAAGANLPIQRIGVDDLVSIQVYDSPELTRTERVAQDGMLRLPLLSKPLKAAGLFPSDLEKSITDELKVEGILVRPIVSVSVSEYRSRPISVVGAVRHPLTFQAFGNVTLLDAITRADGLSDAAGSEILVTRPGQDGEAGLTQRIPVKALMDHADESLNLKLAGGEEIRVPEGGRVFVVGNVRKPGAIPVHDISELTVLRVIAQSDGLLPFAAKNAFILRHGEAGKNEIPVPLEKIMDRKAPDVPLMANDVLYVPDNKGQRNTAKVLEAIAAFGVGTASGLLIFHR
jgi:polysaccharide export outer membrane protein